MKKLFILFFVASYIQLCFGQSGTLNSFNARKNKINKTGFIVLGSWAAGNIIYGAAATSGAHGSNKYFNQMNVMWGAVNLGLATMGYLGAKREGNLSYSESLKKQVKLEKTFLLNAGLDLTYIASGLFLNERSKNVVKDSDKFKGYGESVIFQGAALLLFDAIMYSLHNRHGKELYKLAEKVQITVLPGTIGVVVKM